MLTNGNVLLYYTIGTAFSCCCCCVVHIGIHNECSKQNKQINFNGSIKEVKTRERKKQLHTICTQSRIKEDRKSGQYETAAVAAAWKERILSAILLARSFAVSRAQVYILHSIFNEKWIVVREDCGIKCETRTVNGERANSENRPYQEREIEKKTTKKQVSDYCITLI